jgi:hypothetical protein
MIDQLDSWTPLSCRAAQINKTKIGGAAAPPYRNKISPARQFFATFHLVLPCGPMFSSGCCT